MSIRASRIFVVIVSLIFFSSCGDSDERRNAGYNDGYAVGYNTACQIRATLIEGDFDDADYSKGYAKGQEAGMMACIEDRKAGRIK